MADQQQGGKDNGKGSSRRKQFMSGGWNWLKGKRASNALLATIAGAVATGLAVAGIVVPLNDLKRRVGVIEGPGPIDPVLDHLEAVDEALAAIKSADPVGAVATLAPQVQALAGEVGDIRSALGGEEATTETTAAALTAVVVTTSTTAPSVVPTVMARLDSAEAKLADLAQSLAAEKETSQTLSTAVDGIRTDLSAVRTELAAIKTMATNAQAAADAVAARVDTVEPKLPILTTLPDASIQPGQSADSPQVIVAIPAKAKYLVVFQAAPNNTDRCQVFFAKHNGGNYASVDAAGLDAKLSVRTMELAAGSHTFSATYFAAAAGGNNAPCNVLSPFFWLQKL